VSRAHVLTVMVWKSNRSLRRRVIPLGLPIVLVIVLVLVLVFPAGGRRQSWQTLGADSVNEWESILAGKI
jgi:hypothetical protein